MVGQEVQNHIAGAPCADLTAQFKDGNAADALFRKLHFPAVLGNRLPLPLQADGRLCADTLEAAGIGTVGGDLGQRGIQSGAAVSQRLENGVPIGNAPQLAACAAAAGHDDLVRIVLAPFGFHHEALFGAAHSGHGGTCLGFHPCGINGKAQHIQHGVCGVGQGVHSATLPFHSQQTETAEQLQRIVHVQRFQCGTDKCGVLSVIIGHSGVEVGQIAATVPRSQQLAPHAGLSLI